jgi:hypothetical protein
MRDNSFDRTIERNYIQKWRFLIAEYEEVKAGRSATFRRVGDFYRHHGTCSQTFRKYYNRYLRSGAEADLLPQRRGPKWRERREPERIEAEIIACRRRGMNRYEVHAALRERRDTVPSPSTIYRVFKRHQLRPHSGHARGETSHYQGQDRRTGSCRPAPTVPRHVPGAAVNPCLYRQPDR